MLKIIIVSLQKLNPQWAPNLSPIPYRIVYRTVFRTLIFITLAVSRRDLKAQTVPRLTVKQINSQKKALERTGPEGEIRSFLYKVRNGSNQERSTHFSRLCVVLIKNSKTNKFRRVWQRRIQLKERVLWFQAEVLASYQDF